MSKYLEEALSRTKDISPDELFYTLLVDTAAIEEDLEKLDAHASTLARKAKKINHKLFQAVALRALAVANRLSGKFKDAHGQLLEAKAIFQDVGTSWQLGRTYYEFGQLSAAQDNREDAKSHFVQALQHFEKMGALPDVERTQSAIESLNA